MDNFILSLVPTTAITFVTLGNEIWSPQIPGPKFVARVFPQNAQIQRSAKPISFYEIGFFEGSLTNGVQYVNDE